MITVCDISALARWSESGLIDRLGRPLQGLSGRSWSLTSASEVRPEALAPARLEASAARPLHVLVCAREERARSERIRCHVWSAPLPEGALYQLTDEVLLVSPGFCLRQMTPGSGLARIASAGTELCGSYGRSPGAPRGFYAREAVVTPEGLIAEAAGARGYGARRLREALAHVVAGSRSPMETVVVLLFTLPVEVGGCGLPRPELNFRLEIPPSLQQAIGSPYVRVDLAWPDWLVILEYDSYEFHGTPGQVDRDSVRNEGLRDLGWMVRSVTSGMLKNDRMLAELASRVAARMGRTLPSDPHYLQLRHDLVRDLLRGP